jgi:hypothetical protein
MMRREGQFQRLEFQVSLKSQRRLGPLSGILSLREDVCNQCYIYANQHRYAKDKSDAAMELEEATDGATETVDNREEERTDAAIAKMLESEKLVTDAAHRVEMAQQQRELYQLKKREAIETKDLPIQYPETCPSCPAPIEDTTHFWKCPATTRIKWRKECQKVILDKLNELDTAPPLQSLLLEATKAILDGRPTNSIAIDPAIRHVADAQALIGWDQIFYSFSVKVFTREVLVVRMHYYAVAQQDVPDFLKCFHYIEQFAFSGGVACLFRF